MSISAYAKTVATHYFGPPNKALSNARELRWGTNGSMSLCLIKGTWYDFDADEGGGVIDLVRLREGASIKPLPQILESKFGIPRRDQEQLVLLDKIERIYRYVSEYGELIAEVERWRKPDGNKTFKQYRFVDGRRVSGVKGIEIPLYNLPELLARPDDPVFLVEGEKCADALRKVGLLATTCNGSSGGWKEHHPKHLNGRKIIALPDQDEKGDKFTNKVIASLDLEATQVKIVRLPGLADKGDVVDFFQAGNGRAELLELSRRAPVVVANSPHLTSAPSPDYAGLPDLPGLHAEVAGDGSDAPIGGNPGPSTDTFDVLDIRAIRARPPVEWLVDGVLPDAEFSVLYGPPGAGKSFAALDIALHVAMGRPWHGRATKRGAVLYIAGEGVGGMGQRVKAWQSANAARGNPPLYVVPQAVAMVDAAELGKLLATIDAMGEPVALVVIDTVARSLVGEDENDAKAMGVFVEAAESIKRHTRAAVLGIHHSGKDITRGLRGSSSLLAGVYASLKTERSGDTLTIKAEKQKDAEQGEALAFDLVTVGIIGGSSLVLRSARDGATPERRADPKGAAGLALDVLRELGAFDDRFKNGNRPHIDDWVAACRDRYPDHSASTLSSARQRLVDRGFVFFSAERQVYLAHGGPQDKDNQVRRP